MNRIKNKPCIPITPKWKCNWPLRSNWLCVITLIIFEWFTQNCIEIAININSNLAHLVKTEPFVFQNAIKLFRALLWLLIIYFFSGSRSVRSFWSNVRLNQRPTLAGWVAAWVAILISIIDRYGATNNWTSPNQITRGFFHEGGGALLFYVIYVGTLGPFFEEIAFRGFLYSGLRCKYGQVATTFLVLCVMAYFHLSAMGHSLWTPLCLLSLWALICLTQERTQNLWNCILCHAGYNICAGLAFPACLVAMIAILPICIWRNKHQSTSDHDHQS